MSKKVNCMARAALLAALVLPGAALLMPAAAPFAAITAQAGAIAEHRQTLAKFGTFVEHAKFGEVWVPTVTPEGWHPYPACNWIYTKYGWYFDDKTVWGEIVHHYGRWSHDEKLGWVWVAGEEFSPGWVVWKTNDEWVGWAPMLPEQDLTTVSTEDFNNDKQWTFMEVDKFGKACKGGIAPAQQVPMILTKTKFVKEFVFVDGIMVFVLPPQFIGPIIHITINFNPWSPWFIANTVNFWNTVWNLNINVQIACLAPKPIVAPKNFAPPPPPSPISDDKPQPPIRNVGDRPTIRATPLPFPVIDTGRPGRPDKGHDRPNGRPGNNGGGKGAGSSGGGSADKGGMTTDPCRLLGRCGGKRPIDPQFGRGDDIKHRPIVERPLVAKPQFKIGGKHGFEPPRGVTPQPNRPPNQGRMSFRR